MSYEFFDIPAFAKARMPPLLSAKRLQHCAKSIALRIDCIPKMKRPREPATTPQSRKLLFILPSQIWIVKLASKSLVLSIAT